MNWDGLKRKRTRRKKVKQKIREPCHSNAHEGGGGDTSWLNQNVFFGVKKK